MLSKTKVTYSSLFTFPLFLLSLLFLNLLRMDHQPSQVHLLNKHCGPTLLDHTIRHTIHEFVHLRPAISYPMRSIPGQLSKLEGIIFHTYVALLQVNEL